MPSDSNQEKKPSGLLRKKMTKDFFVSVCLERSNNCKKVECNDFLHQPYCKCFFCEIISSLDLGSALRTKPIVDRHRNILAKTFGGMCNKPLLITTEICSIGQFYI